MAHDPSAQPAPPRWKPPRRLVLTLLLALAGGALYVLDPLDGESASKRADSNVGPQRQPVLAAEVEVKPMPVEISTIGRVQTIKSVAIRSRIAGVIAEVSVRDGQDVKIGDPLFRLDDRDAKAQLRQAEATLTRDQVALDNARRDLKRTAALIERNVAARQQLDQQQAAVDGLVAQLREDDAAIERTKVQLSYTLIQAPIEGRVGTVNFKLGSSIGANDQAPLLTINQLRPVYVAFSVAQRHLAEIQDALAAGPLPVTATVPGAEAAVQRGSVAFIENAIDASTNTLSVKAEFPNAETRLWPAQFVNVVLTLRTEPNAIVVPSEAVRTDQDGSHVFVIKPDSTVEMRSVVVKRVIANQSVVDGALSAGERVVTRGQLRLQPGTPVEIKQPAAHADGRQGVS